MESTKKPLLKFFLDVEIWKIIFPFISAAIPIVLAFFGSKYSFEYAFAIFVGVSIAIFCIINSMKSILEIIDNFTSQNKLIWNFPKFGQNTVVKSEEISWVRPYVEIINISNKPIRYRINNVSLKIGSVIATEETAINNGAIILPKMQSTFNFNQVQDLFGKINEKTVGYLKFEIEYGFNAYDNKEELRYIIKPAIDLRTGEITSFVSFNSE